MHIAVVDWPIDLGSLLDRVGGAGDGAVVVFLGTVRDHSEGRTVVGLEYEAYRPMAERVLRELAEGVRRSFEVSEIAVEHRVGRLAVGDVSVAIAVSAPHRDAAYRASREVIERLKREVPIWKREIYADGESEWIEGSGVRPESGRSARAAESASGLALGRGAGGR